ncbi:MULTISPECIES: hypothetical protein [unclassified Microbacterium]|uniref:hypothetical protein n=1 Tax=unclassified Microbacterium TaxID=2609290 RepID=UPI0025DD484D|nr:MULTISPECIES: hypothetical protein [unclassified Microbacterium]
MRHPRRWLTAIVAVAVDASKLSSWFLLMVVSVVLVTWVCPPREPDPIELSAVDKGIAVP